MKNEYDNSREDTNQEVKRHRAPHHEHPDGQDDTAAAEPRRQRTGAGR
jgi:hypothetical protein